MLVTQVHSRKGAALSQVCVNISRTPGSGIRFSPVCLHGAIPIQMSHLKLQYCSKLSLPIQAPSQAVRIPAKLQARPARRTLAPSARRQPGNALVSASAFSPTSREPCLRNRGIIRHRLRPTSRTLRPTSRTTFLRRTIVGPRLDYWANPREFLNSLVDFT